MQGRRRDQHRVTAGGDRSCIGTVTFLGQEGNRQREEAERLWAEAESLRQETEELRERWTHRGKRRTQPGGGAEKEWDVRLVDTWPGGTRRIRAHD